MKRMIVTIGVVALLLFVLTAMVNGKRVISDNKTPTKAEQNVPLPEKNVSQPPSQSAAAPVSTFDFEEATIAVDPLEAASTLEPSVYQIPWQSINSGGDDLSSDNYQMLFSVGQSAVGYATSDNYEAGIGYWYGAGGMACDCGVPGDMDGGGGVPTPLDVSYLVNKVFKGLDALWDYTATGCPLQNGDVDCSGGAPTPLDVSYLVNKVYKSLDALCQDRCAGVQ